MKKTVILAAALIVAALLAVVLVAHVAGAILNRRFHAGSLSRRML